MATARAIRVQRPSWANLRTALGLLLFCAALVAGQQVIAGAKDTTQVWVAARDLPADTVLGVDDLRAEEVSLSDDLQERYLSASSNIEGRMLSRPVLTGEMVAGSWVLEEAGETARTMTISLDSRGQAAAGIGLGDLVDVIATFDAGDVRSKTVPVVRGAEVTELVRTRGLVEGSDVVGLTVSVPEELVGMVAFAGHNAEIDVVKVSGGTTSSNDWSVTRENF
ncbi:MAG: SAF domain-containing protein [Actinomycetota bacterium]